MTQINLEYFYNFINETSQADACLYGLLFLLSTYLLIRLFKGKKKKFKRKRYGKLKKQYYNKGFKILFSAWDKIKFKLRLGDYDSTKGIRYIYLFQIKLFNLEFYKVKYIDQQGRVYKRRVKFRS